jgi:hypothetical protein
MCTSSKIPSFKHSRPHWSSVLRGFRCSAQAVSSSMSSAASNIAPESRVSCNCDPSLARHSVASRPPKGRSPTWNYTIDMKFSFDFNAGNNSRPHHTHRAICMPNTFIAFAKAKQEMERLGRAPTVYAQSPSHYSPFQLPASLPDSQTPA